MNEKIFFVFEETSQRNTFLPSKGGDNDYWISAFVEDIISLTGAEHSKAGTQGPCASWVRIDPAL